ncbi:MAG: asparagine--tRNA ligase [Treponemataceae bacterium]
MKKILIKDLLTSKPDLRTVVVEGWVRTKRDSKNLVFLQVNDGSCFASIQITYDRDSNANNANINQTIEDELKKVSTGASICATGLLSPSPASGQAVEVVLQTLSVIGEAPSDFPMQKKGHTVEFLRENAHLRPRTNMFGAVARMRSQIAYAVHTFFMEQGFVYVHTPIITASDCEGAGEMFQVTTLDVEKLVQTGAKSIDYSKDFFGKKASLTVSGQLEAETYATALSNVYTFGPTFRAENSNTPRHLAEFWMIEPEMAFCNLEGNMDVAESFIKYLLNWALTKCAQDMQFFDDRVQKGLIDVLTQVVHSDFHRITYTQAIEQLEKNADNFEYKPHWGCDLQTEHERYLTETLYKKPVIVTDYPKEIKAFYMKQNDDGKTVRAMDILVPGIGEIIGGSERESDYQKLYNRIVELDLNPEDYWWYMDLRKYGTVPHAGFGLGFERILRYITGMGNLRDVIPFPRAPKLADF